MAPEQVGGRPVSPATDVFALAHLVTFAANGHTVFGDGNFAALVYRIANEDPNLDDCPDSLRPLVARCLARNPAARPALTEIMEFARQMLSGQTFGLIGASWLPDPVASNLSAYNSAAIPPPAGTRPPVSTVPVPGPPNGVSSPGSHPSFPSVPGGVPAAVAAKTQSYPRQPGYPTQSAGWRARRPGHQP
jgi:serine/threonine protein kinase